MHASSAEPRPVGPQLLGDFLPIDARVRTALLIGSGCLLMALLAQVRIPLWFTPVPITGQTFGVALLGGALGSWRAASALGLYVFLGGIGCPFYAGGESGWTHVFGSTGGYLIGFVLAGWAVGALAERRFVRRPLQAFLTFQLGSVIVFACGLAGLMLTLGVGAGRAAELGWFPFIPGDLIKSTVAAMLFPSAWAAARSFEQGE
ncbi:MAG: biotin transporter BioY [bacterium]|nr:biotin transporter BioY [bacterium]